MNAPAITSETADRIVTATSAPLVMIAAHLTGGKRIIFHYGLDVVTVHSAASYEFGAYTDIEGARLLVSGTPVCGEPENREVHASPEEADYASRVLAQLIAHLPDTDEQGDRWIRGAAMLFLDILTARAERHVWCLRADNGHIARVDAAGITDSEYEDVLASEYDDDMLAHIGIFDGDAEDHFTIERVPEADIPASITIEGIAST